MFPLPETPMLDDGDEGGVKQWHLVKANEEAELPKHRRGSLRDKERERAKAIPEIYLTRLLSVKVPHTHATQSHSTGDRGRRSTASLLLTMCFRGHCRSS